MEITKDYLRYSFNVREIAGKMIRDKFCLFGQETKNKEIEPFFRVNEDTKLFYDCLKIVLDENNIKYKELRNMNFRRSLIISGYNECFKFYRLFKTELIRLNNKIYDWFKEKNE